MEEVPPPPEVELPPPLLDPAQIHRVAAARLLERITLARADPAAFIEFALRTPEGNPIVLADFHREWLTAMKDGEMVLIEAPRGHGKCQPGESTVLCADGTRRRIDSLTAATKVITYDKANRKFTTAWTKPVQTNGVKEVFEVEDTTGRSVRVTTEHPFLKFNGWTPCADLAVGDYVALFDGSVGETLGQTRVPYDLAWLTGLCLGDGTLNHASATVTSGDTRIREEVKRIAANRGFRIREAKNSANSHNLYFVRPTGLRKVGGHTHLYALTGLVPGRAETKRIPARFFAADQFTIAHLLAGLLDSDGSVNPLRGGSVEYYSVSRALLEDVQHLLLRLDVVATLAPKLGQYKGAPHHSWRLTIRSEDLGTFTTFVCPRGRRSRALNVVAANPFRSTLMPPEWRARLGATAHFIRKNFKLRVDNQYETTKTKALRVANALNDASLAADIQAPLRWTKIKSIKSVGFHETWALEVEDHHTYITEDYVTHNTSVTIGFILWLLGTNPNLRIKLLSQNDDKAKERLFEIRQNLEQNTALKMVFPHLEPDASGEWTKTKLYVKRTAQTRDPSFQAGGILTSVTGGRIDFLICDDVCVTPETEILTPTGYRKAVDLRIGDFVIDIEGTPQPIVARRQRPYEGYVYSPRFGNNSNRAGCGTTFWGTRDHKLRTDQAAWQRLDAMPVATTLFAPKVKDYGTIAQTIAALPTIPVYKPGKVGRGGTWSPVDWNSHRKLFKDPGFWRLLGYYVAEGYADLTQNGGKVVFTCNNLASDRVMRNDIRAIVRRLFQRRVTLVRRGPKTVQLVFSHVVFSKLFKSLGAHARTKALPPWVFLAPRKLVFALLCGITRGDGTTPHGRETIIKSASYKLVRDIGGLLLRLGHPFAIRKGDKPKLVKINGYIGKGRGSWTVRTPGIPFGLVGVSRTVPMKRAMPWSQTYFTTKQGFHTRVAQVRRKKYNGPVINIEVAGTHSYSHGMFVSKNCDLRNSILYPSLREDIKTKFNGEILGTLTPDAKVVYIATPYHMADLTAVLKQNPMWKVMQYHVGTAENPCVPLWPEMWTEELLQKKRITMGSVEYDRAYRCLAVSGNTVPCKPEWIQFYTAALLGDPLQHACIQGYDLAISKKTSADYFAHVTLLYDRERHYIFVVDVTQGRFSFAEQGMEVVMNHKRWLPDKVIIETVGLGGGLESFLREKGPPDLPLQGYHPRGDKQRRFLEITPLFEDKRIFFHPKFNPHANPYITETGDIVTQLLEFPVGAHDDMVDALVTAISGLNDYFMTDPDPEWEQGDGTQVRLSVVG